MVERREQLLEIMEDAARGETKATLRARIAELEAEIERLREQITKATDPTYLEEKLRQIGITDAMASEALSRTGGMVKPLDLSNLLRHAFFEGFMIAGGSQEAAAEWWPEYDPETCPAYSRILSALEPAAPEGQQEAGR